MPLKLTEMFDPRDKRYGRVGTAAWNKEVFRRAYCDRTQRGKFDDVIMKLRSGFSVLVRLPGNCMTAAADIVVKEIDKNWQSFGVHPGSENPLDAWRGANSFVQSLRSWLQQPDGQEPHAVFHNLDLLTDGLGRVQMSEFAQSAMFSLIEAARNGVVLGLVDRDMGELPATIRNAFTDQVVLDVISDSGFRQIIPLKLGERISVDGQTVPDGPIEQITSRLCRWDPIRAVKIMSEVALDNQSGEIDRILEEIRRRTCPPEFEIPQEDSARTRDQRVELKGFDKSATLNLVNNQIITPFRRWLNQPGTDLDTWRREARKLPRGAILYGPAGTGKTTLAREIARVLQLPIRIVSAAEIRRPMFGDAERMVQKLFVEAQRAAPCILVLDDADDLFPNRSKLNSPTSTADLGIVNAALQQIEGVKAPLTGVLILMTTNLFQQLDPAFSQRLPLHIKVTYPVNREQIEEIVDVAAEEYGFSLTSDIKQQLIEEFYLPINVNDNLGPNTTEDDRRKLNEGLYAARMIVRDMLLLQGGEIDAEGKYTPTDEDLSRLREYHESCRKNQPAGRDWH